MAEAVVISIAEDIVAYLVPRAFELVGKFCAIKHEIGALRKTVATLQAVLDDAEEQYYQNREIQVWLEKLTDAFYEVQDVLEEFDIEAMRRDLRGRNKMWKEVRTFFSSSNQLAFKLKMIYKVRAVRVRLEAIETDRKFHLEEERPKREWRNREETHSFIPRGDITGRDDDKDNIMEFLVDSNVEENVSILPIVGIGGLGKTALAKYVYGDSKFDLKMWVCVSFEFDVKKIVKKMLACAKGKEPTEDTMELLKENLKEEIDKKKYLLVLDDVWDIGQETWRRLKILLGESARGSKILITTRFPSVAEITGTTLPHYLQGLSENASVDLLMQMACRKEEERQDYEMLAIATEIVRKCSGVPLVVRTVGHLLSFKETKREWLLFKDQELPEVSQNEDDIKSVLKLSYDYLPSHLKQCFALCSLFPKDYEIKKQTLVNLWMAEGFIQPSNRSQHLEDIAHKYFMDLFWSNFFQDFKKDPYTNEDTCKMHDLMHDLACLVAGNRCWAAWDYRKSIHERTHHISYGSAFNLIGGLPMSRLKESALRTFLSTTRYWEEKRQIDQSEPTREADLCQLIQNFKKLRILDLHGRKVEKVPQSICKLKYLTYLDLSNNHKLKRLPNSITRLQSLQTLNLDGCFALEELPSDIRKLVSLRNLDIDGCSISYMPCGLGELSFLHKLTRFILPKDKACAKNYCGLGELNGLNNIRGRLKIENLSYATDAEVESNDAILIGKGHLETLILDWDPGRGYAVVGDREDVESGDEEDVESGDGDGEDVESGDEEDEESGDGDGEDDALIGDAKDDVVTGNRDEALLGRLRPHANLQELGINRYEGENFPWWMMMNSLVSFLPHLVKVWFRFCRRCKRLPPLGQLPSLKSIYIEGLTELEYIELDHSSTLATSFPSLSILSVSGCEKLEAMPLTRRLEELELTSVNAAFLINQMRDLSNLKRLNIWDMRFLEYLPEEERFRSLTALESLHITDCHQLTSLSQGMLHLTSLVDLSIGQCKELDISTDKSGNILDFHGGLQNLRSVEIFHLPKLTSLPQWLLQARNLERLNIWECRNLKDIPEQIEALQSLKQLEIRWCHSLTSSPEGVRGLASLTDLTMIDCGELGKRCKRDAGNLAHIPNITIKP